MNTRCYEGPDSCSVLLLLLLLFNVAAWCSKAARCWRLQSLAYRLSVCASSCWCVPRSAIDPLLSTRISSASTTVASRCAMIIVVRFAMARFNAPTIFWNSDKWQTESPRLPMTSVVFQGHLVLKARQGVYYGPTERLHWWALYHIFILHGFEAFFLWVSMITPCMPGSSVTPTVTMTLLVQFRVGTA